MLDPRRKHFPTLLSDGRGRRVDLLLPRGRRRRRARRAGRLDAGRAPLPPDVEPASAPGTGWSTAATRVLEHAERRGVTLGLRARAGDARRDAGRLRRAARRGSAHPPRSGSRSTSGTAVCLEPMPVADCVRRGGADARPRPHRGHAPRRARAPDVRRRASSTSPAALARAARRSATTGWSRSSCSRHSHAAHETGRRARDRRACASRADSEAVTGERLVTELTGRRSRQRRAARRGRAWLAEAIAGGRRRPGRDPHALPGGRAQGRARAAGPGRRPRRRPRLDDRRRGRARCCSRALRRRRPRTSCAELYRYGDAAERRGVLRALPYLAARRPRPRRCVDDAIRTNDTRLIAAALGPVRDRAPADAALRPGRAQVRLRRRPDRAARRRSPSA